MLSINSNRIAESFTRSELGNSNSSSSSIVKQKKRSFNGFSESDVKTTKAVQELYFTKFTAKGRSQEDAASIVNWSQSTLNLYLNGKQRIGDTALRKFCILLEVEPRELNREYFASKENDRSGENKELLEMKNILAELVDAVTGNRDLELIVMKAKNIVNG